MASSLQNERPRLPGRQPATRFFLPEAPAPEGNRVRRGRAGGGEAAGQAERTRPRSPSSPLSRRRLSAARCPRAGIYSPEGQPDIFFRSRSPTTRGSPPPASCPRPAPGRRHRSPQERSRLSPPRKRPPPPQAPPHGYKGFEKPTPVVSGWRPRQLKAPPFPCRSVPLLLHLTGRRTPSKSQPPVGWMYATKEGGSRVFLTSS
ncbi:serine/arginine repetitive matrix protein 1-like [Calypte anna]|uniref:serine/arginine repetitive matrix protein 1-like n=1 Tax=Calypte anna TaxID=9244 RepID=UPI0011C47050|nr:serine/arginine repetitive matrix protein 1-like [Calypte anna]